MSDGFEVLA